MLGGRAGFVVVEPGAKKGNIAPIVDRVGKHILKGAGGEPAFGATGHVPTLFIGVCCIF